MAAVKAKNKEAVRALIKAGCDIGCVSINKYTIFHEAVEALTVAEYEYQQKDAFIILQLLMQRAHGTSLAMRVSSYGDTSASILASSRYFTRNVQAFLLATLLQLWRSPVLRIMQY